MYDCSINTTIENFETAHNPRQTQPFVDLCFLSSSGENHRIRKSAYNAAFILQSIQSSANPLVSLYLSLFPLRSGDVIEAVHFLREAARKGSATAMRVVSRLYTENRESFFADHGSSCDISALWAMRSARCGSNDALFALAEAYRGFRMNLKAFCAYWKCFNSQKYIVAAINALEILSMLQNRRETQENVCKLARFVVARGEPAAIPKILANNFSVAVNTWGTIWEKYEIKHSNALKDVHYLNNSFEDNMSIYSTRVLSQLLSSVDPFKSFKTSVFILQRYPSNDVGENNEIVTKKDEIIKDVNIIDGFYPSKNKTRLFLQMFEYASPDIEKRNLNFVSSILFQLYGENYRGITFSRLWQEKIKSKKLNDQISCGLICLILKDIKTAFILLQKAALRGNIFACSLCGILLFYSTDNKKAALMFFSKCSLDPISLIHLYLVFQDESYFDQASSLLGQANNPNKYHVLEIIGDIFKDGVKYPQNYKIAKIFYEQAVIRAEHDNMECPCVYEKIDFCTSSERK